MANRQGDFIWYELMTDNADAAQKFYAGLIGWTFKDSGNPEMDYRLFSSATAEVGGVMPLTPEMVSGGARSAWLGYIAVDDVDASVASIKAAGGAIHMHPWDVPGVGRLAFLADPQGAMFYVMLPISPAEISDAESRSFAANEPMVGHCAWNELASSEPEAAKAFYGAQFGWVPDGAMDMGELGQYEFWNVGDDRGHMIGAVMPMMPGMPMSAWTFYFRVPEIDAAVEYTKAHDGTALQEPTEIPGGEFSFTGLDPQGAIFGLVGPRKGN
ncbi:VOC family protein [Qipengyuania sp. ASV99]|uniref:VOC family protein n=1 Tax=Qipengyuania sp. ASV99 TaxID=3399681 RepID=UPI003A4C7E95